MIISKEAQTIINNGYGFRDDSTYDECITNPYDVCLFEVSELGNLDIPKTLLKLYKDKLSSEQINFLDDLIDINYWDDSYESDYLEILSTIIGNRNYCLWVCSSEEEVLELYGDNIEKYDIPKDSIILSDLSNEGVLFCWKE